MDLLDNPINKRILSGNYPDEALIYEPIQEFNEIDFAVEGKKGIDIMLAHPELLSVSCMGLRDRVKELGFMDGSEDAFQEINCMINTRYDQDCLNFNGLVQDAFIICPVVTEIERMIRLGAFLYQQTKLLSMERSYKAYDMMFAWLYLFTLVQEKEIKTGLTINAEKISLNTNLMDIINKPWESSNKYLCKITVTEEQQLKQLNKKREEVLNRIKEERLTSKKVAEKTDSDWKLFLKVVNDLSEKESSVIEQIINDYASANDKKAAISEYRSALRRIEKGQYLLDDNIINLLDILGSANERLQKASFYANASTETDKPFRLHPAIIALVIDSKTYNSIFIAFHEFRLSPNRDNAKRFMTTALFCLKRNLNLEYKEWASMDDMIMDFHDSVIEFFNENKIVFDNLSFKSIQNDSVNIDGSYQVETEYEMFQDKLAGMINTMEQDGEYDKKLDALIKGSEQVVSLEEINSYIDKIQELSAINEQEAHARQLIVSLNTIYLFCGALRMMLTNKHAHIKIRKPDIADKYRRDLLKIDTELVGKVYGNLDSNEMDMLEYRERNGIEYITLSEQENQEEVFRNTAFSDIMKNGISELIDHIGKQDIDGIIETKSKIKEQIRSFPSCDEKEQYAAWLDSISEEISEALIHNCKLRMDDFDQLKANLLHSLGEKSIKLPTSTIDSLITAEMLYGQYANMEYAEKGFDFSCISALYYQAFEDAYNDLIWHGYADRLNALQINGVEFTSFLNKNRGKITDMDYMGYLDKDGRQRSYYIQYPSKERHIQECSVSKRCMYKSFAIMMSNINEESKLEKFCDYFAGITGYSDRTALFADKSFMSKCKEFTCAIDNSADDRNNASHGGTFISMKQCAADKKTVLNELEEVRSSSLGLIQQLLYILFK